MKSLFLNTTLTSTRICHKRCETQVLQQHVDDMLGLSQRVWVIRMLWPNRHELQRMRALQRYENGGMCRVRSARHYLAWLLPPSDSLLAYVDRLGHVRRNVCLYLYWSK